MHYEGVIYRPPSEAYSLIIQVTIGCAHNQCSFCGMYKEKKFRIRDTEEIIADLREARDTYKFVDRIFLADGDALVLSTEKLKKILENIRELFPECKRVGVYGAPKDILNKSMEELQQLKTLGVGMIYLGVESGSDRILEDICKGVSAEEMILAGQRVKQSGIKLSVTLISGIGGKDYLQEHALQSAKVVSEINPDYLGFLTLMIEKNTELYQKIKRGEFQILNTQEVLLELKTFIQEVKVTNTVFRSNHASNYINLAGNLPQDKEKILDQLQSALDGDVSLKQEWLRRL